jgi:hypothetical protein
VLELEARIRQPIEALPGLQADRGRLPQGDGVGRGGDRPGPHNAGRPDDASGVRSYDRHGPSVETGVRGPWGAPGGGPLTEIHGDRRRLLAIRPRLTPAKPTSRSSSTSMSGESGRGVLKLPEGKPAMSMWPPAVRRMFRAGVLSGQSLSPRHRSKPR